jgi:hypothetical protein
MSQSNGGLETSNPPAVPNKGQQPPATRDAGRQQQQQSQQSAPAEKPLSLAELFAESDENQDSDDGEASVDSIDSLKKHGLTSEQIYALKVPLADGAEPIALGELKDRVKELVDFETRELQFDQRRQKSEGELLRAQTEIRDILGMIPKEQLNPALINRLRQQREATQARESELTLQHIPAWENEKTRAEDLKGMIDYLGEWGFPPQFIETLVDHRALKFVRDSYLRDKRIKQALSKVTIPVTGKRPSGKTGKPPVKPGAPSRRQVAVGQRDRIMNFLNSSE